MNAESPWCGEHRSRYRFAATSVSGQRVLDIACGTGFGTRILAEAGAGLAVGIDITITFDREPDRDNLVWCQGDGTKLPLKSKSFDTISSFETIEHVVDDGSFLGELRRVLTDDGTLLLSTPNSLVSPKRNGKPANPYHVREYEPDHLLTVLAPHFAHVELLGQGPSADYKVCPYWEGPKAPDDTLLTRARVIAWKLQNRLPYRWKEGWSRVVHHRSFFPGEFDFEFSRDRVEKGHVLLAVCRGLGRLG